MEVVLGALRARPTRQQVSRDRCSGNNNRGGLAGGRGVARVGGARSVLRGSAGRGRPLLVSSEGRSCLVFIRGGVDVVLIGGDFIYLLLFLVSAEDFPWGF